MIELGVCIGLRDRADVYESSDMCGLEEINQGGECSGAVANGEDYGVRKRRGRWSWKGDGFFLRW